MSGWMAVAVPETLGDLDQAHIPLTPPDPHIYNPKLEAGT